MHHDHDSNGACGETIAYLPHQLPGFIFCLVLNLEHAAEVLSKTMWCASLQHTPCTVDSSGTYTMLWRSLLTTFHSVCNCYLYLLLMFSYVFKKLHTSICKSDHTNGHTTQVQVCNFARVFVAPKDPIKRSKIKQIESNVAKISYTYMIWDFLQATGTQVLPGQFAWTSLNLLGTVVRVWTAEQQMMRPCFDSVMSLDLFYPTTRTIVDKF